MDTILELRRDLLNRTYRHGPYHQFRINDPKPREISKASVRDRLLHHAVYRVLYPFFARRFIADSFSCQEGKGTHKALNRFRSFAYRVSRNHTRTCWVLKCDIRKFFASIDQDILLDILASSGIDPDTLWLLNRIISSFSSGLPAGRQGLPLGNLTSQLLVNIYMNEFDQFVKHQLKAPYYLRYADDFAVLSHDKGLLMEILPKMGDFLQERLNLDLHSRKVSIRTLSSGVDFLGWVHFPDHRVLRTATKRRMMRRMAESPTEATRQSYRGMLGWGNARKIRDCLEKQANFQ
jgi:RNA-directed DNA polymerase